MEAIFIYISTIIFIFSAITRWTGNLAIPVRSTMVLMAIFGIILSLIKLGFVLAPGVHL